MDLSVNPVAIEFISSSATGMKHNELLQKSSIRVPVTHTSVKPSLANTGGGFVFLFDAYHCAYSKFQRRQYY